MTVLTPRHSGQSATVMEGLIPQNYGLLVTAPRTASWRLGEHCGAKAASPRDGPAAQDATTIRLR
jgi:hypothetical protein